MCPLKVRLNQLIVRVNAFILCFICQLSVNSKTWHRIPTIFVGNCYPVYHTAVISSHILFSFIEITCLMNTPNIKKPALKKAPALRIHTYKWVKLAFFNFFFTSKSVENHFQILSYFLFGAAFNAVAWHHSFYFPILEESKSR